ncbi:MAG: DUF2085 domain-containing protein [Anaerotignum sp.]
MVDFLERMGSAVCHQMAERSFIWGNGKMPLCARCTGIYIGVFFALCFFLWKKRLKGNRPFSAKQIFLMLLCIIPMAADGFCSYAGFWESNQLLRILTGSLIGAVVPGLLLLAGNFDPVEENDKAIYENTKELLFVVVCSGAFGLCLWLGVPLRGIGAVLSIAGEVCLWAGVLWLILKNIFGKRKLPLGRISLVLSFCIIFAVGGFLP